MMMSVISSSEDDSEQDAPETFQCPFSSCDKSYNKAWRLTEHICSHTGERPFICDEPGCEKTFIRQNHLQRHRVTHTDEKPFQCSQCVSAFTTMSNLRKHERIHSKRKPHTCTVEGCSEAFIKKTQLYRHQLITHEITTPFQCDICSQSFTTQSHLNRHKRKHFGRFMCTDCLEIFDKFSALQKHIAAVHKKELVCPYSYCDKVFTTQSSLNSHLRTVHLTPDSGVSSLIEMKCESLGSSSAQQSECGESAAQSECGESVGPSECGESVILDTTLTSEVQAEAQSSAETPTTDLTCNICNKMFKRKSNLTSHKKTVHKITLITEFKCDFRDECNLVFNHKYNLIKHIQSKHEGIKQFQCIHCPQQFYHKHAFERHVVRVHQSEKVRIKRAAWNKVSPLENITGCIKNDQVREYVEKMREFGAAQNQPALEEDTYEDLEKLKMIQRVTECSSNESPEEDNGDLPNVPSCLD